MKTITSHLKKKKKVLDKLIFKYNAVSLLISG